MSPIGCGIVGTIIGAALGGGFIAFVPELDPIRIAAQDKTTIVGIAAVIGACLGLFANDALVGCFKGLFGFGCLSFLGIELAIAVTGSRLDAIAGVDASTGALIGAGAFGILSAVIGAFGGADERENPDAAKPPPAADRINSRPAPASPAPPSRQTQPGISSAFQERIDEAAEEAWIKAIVAASDSFDITLEAAHDLSELKYRTEILPNARRYAAEAQRKGSTESGILWMIQRDVKAALYAAIQSEGEFSAAQPGISRTFKNRVDAALAGAWDEAAEKASRDFGITAEAARDLSAEKYHMDLPKTHLLSLKLKEGDLTADEIIRRIQSEAKAAFYDEIKSKAALAEPPVDLSKDFASIIEGAWLNAAEKASRDFGFTVAAVRELSAEKYHTQTLPNAHLYLREAQRKGLSDGEIARQIRRDVQDALYDEIKSMAQPRPVQTGISEAYKSRIDAAVAAAWLEAAQSASVEFGIPIEGAEDIVAGYDNAAFRSHLHTYAAAAKQEGFADDETIRRIQRDVKAVIYEAVKGAVKNAIKLNLPLRDYQNLPKLDTPAGYVYLIQDSEFGRRCKIAYTNNPADRLKRLPPKTKVIAILKTHNAAALKKHLQKKYAAAHKKGDWFDLSKSQIAEIRSM